MTTEDSINQRIATLLGWTIKPRKVSPLYHFVDDTVYDTYSPDGQIVQTSETLAGACARLPDYLNDLNAVYAVLPSNAIAQSFRNNETYLFQIMIDGDDFCVDGKSEAGYSVAAAKALLAYLNWKAEQKEET